MVRNLTILKNLVRINRLYSATSSQIEALMYAKLAVLELCGWVEEAMDQIVLDTSIRLLTVPTNQQFIETKVVRPTYGFEYDAHFRKMLMGVIGLIGVETMEGNVDRLLFDPMCGALSTLKPNRNTHSHTYLKGVTIRIDAPTNTIAHCRTICAGLRDVERVLGRM